MPPIPAAAPWGCHPSCQRCVSNVARGLSADISFGTESAGARLNWNIELRWVKVSHKIFSRAGDDIDFTQGLPVPSCLLHSDVSFNPHQHFLFSLLLPFFWSSGRPFCTFSRCTCSTCIVNYNCPLPSLGAKMKTNNLTTWTFKLSDSLYHSNGILLIE